MWHACALQGGLPTVQGQVSHPALERLPPPALEGRSTTCAAPVRGLQAGLSRCDPHLVIAHDAPESKDEVL